MWIKHVIFPWIILFFINFWNWKYLYSREHLKQKHSCFPSTLRRLSVTQTTVYCGTLTYNFDLFRSYNYFCSSFPKFIIQNNNHGERFFGAGRTNLIHTTNVLLILIHHFSSLQCRSGYWSAFSHQIQKRKTGDYRRDFIFPYLRRFHFFILFHLQFGMRMDDFFNNVQKNS